MHVTAQVTRTNDIFGTFPLTYREEQTILRLSSSTRNWLKCYIISMSSYKSFMRETPDFRQQFGGRNMARIYFMRTTTVYIKVYSHVCMYVCR